MTVVSLIILDRDADTRRPAFVEHVVTGISYNPDGVVEDLDVRQPCPVDIAAVAALCNDAVVVANDDGTFEKIGEATEAALCTLAEKMGTPAPDPAFSPGGAGSGAGS